MYRGKRAEYSARGTYRSEYEKGRDVAGKFNILTKSEADTVAPDV